MAGNSVRESARVAGITAGITALAIDAVYTTIWWLVLGRNERRTKTHAELRYFGIIGQLAAEVAAIVHLVSLLKAVGDGARSARGRQ